MEMTRIPEGFLRIKLFPLGDAVLCADFLIKKHFKNHDKRAYWHRKIEAFFLLFFVFREKITILRRILAFTLRRA